MVAVKPRRKREPLRRTLTDPYLKQGVLVTINQRSRSGTARVKRFNVWDEQQPGLFIRVTPKAVDINIVFYVEYRHEGKPVWYKLDRYGAIGLADARKAARQIRAKATLGQHPQGEKKAGRMGDTLSAIYPRYMEDRSRERKSWRQGDYLMRRHVLPKFGNRKPKDLTRTDMYALFDALRDTPGVANGAMAAVSAMFTWMVKRNLAPDNPCRDIAHHKQTPSKRFLSNDEIRLVWPVLDEVLRLVLLTAQRPGEVTSMRWEHVDLGAELWTMPGVPTTGWPGTKTKQEQEVPLTAPVLQLLRDLDPKPAGHVFPSATRKGKAIKIPSTRDRWSGTRYRAIPSARSTCDSSYQDGRAGRSEQAHQPRARPCTGQGRESGRPWSTSATTSVSTSGAHWNCGLRNCSPYWPAKAKRITELRSYRYPPPWARGGLICAP